ncbi:MAG: polyphosphate polymerase domain-containing protein [Lachnospiraceae bacterium]|nr:polyphosphate polymerase domain-containing protein [Lachnospiraceae bacterium]
MSGFRHEDKYLIDSAQAGILRLKAEGAFFHDPYAGADGMYRISSLYFDDPDNTCFYDNEDGTGKREKYRIRIYNDDPGYLRLERKEKRGGLTRKTSAEISPEQCGMMMRGETPEAYKGQAPVADSLFQEMRLRSMQPKVVVSYRRIPFVYPAGNVRLTFDHDIESSMVTKGFPGGGMISRPVLPPGMCVMELKWDGLLPVHLIEVLQTEGLRRYKFSKYSMCRKVTVY